MHNKQIKQLFSQLSTCMQVDKRPLSKRLHGLNNRLKQGKPIDVALADISQKIKLSFEKCQHRKILKPKFSYPEALPISAKREVISKAIEAHQVVIVAGETGSGKTTQIPKICLDLGRGVSGVIGHTQPRRIAARSVASRIAQELGSQVGEHVGYKVRFSDHSKKDGYIKLMTDGILLAEIQSDPRLEAYDTIIIDEAHERSLNIDFLLGYLKQLLPKRADLKVIVTSATINTEHFSNFFNQAPVIEVSGRSYPVDILYHPIGGDEDKLDHDLPQAIVAAVDHVGSLDALGDVLVFLPGEREIREASHALEQHTMKNTEVIPLFSRLSVAEQDRVFQAHRGRRVILATNVAETSLTVPGIRFVIDTGLARVSRYSARTKVQRLPIEPISQASANQRSGRCGRVAAGVCVRLYDEDSFEQRRSQTDPEILRTNLASVILKMASLGLGDVAKFPFMNPPEPRSISDGYRLLHELQAVDESRKLTATGRQLVRLPVDPRLGRMLLQANQERCLAEVLVITSALSVQDPRSRPMDAQQKADEKHRIFSDETSDFMGWLKLWLWYHEQARLHSKSQLRKLCQKHFLSYVRLREWHDLHGQLLSVLHEFKMRLNQQQAKPDEIHRALLSGLLGHIAVLDEGKQYLGARNLKLSVFPGSGLYKKPPKWFMAADLVETTRLYARTLAPIDPLWLESLAAHLINREYSEPHWSMKRGQVLAYEKVSLFGLPILSQRRVNYSQIEPALSRELFIKHALVLGEYRTHAKYAQHNEQLIDALETMEAKSRRRDMLAEEQVIFEFFDAIIPESVCSGKLFEQWRKSAESKQANLLFLSKDVLLATDDAGLNEQDFPDMVQVGVEYLHFEYHFDPTHHADGITLLLPLAMLTQLQASSFEWLVPGMLHEKLSLLIKTLPKSLRRSFVPAPQFAAAAMESMIFRQGSLLSEFSKSLESMSGVHITLDQWDMDKLPKYLSMNFRIVDENGKKLDESSDLMDLQQRFSTGAKVSSQPAKFERDSIKCWDFEDLPEQLLRKSHGLELKLYPALVDQLDSVAIQMFDDQGLAKRSMRQGLCRLLMLLMPQQVKVLDQGMQKMKSMMMLAALQGDVALLRQQLIRKIFESVFLTDDLPRTKGAFDQCLNQGRAGLIQQGQRMIGVVGAIFKSHTNLQAAIHASVAPQKKAMLDDVTKQMQSLLYDGFIETTSAKWLVHIPRFLDAARLRVEKMGVDLNKDQQLSNQIDKFWQQYQQRLLLLKGQGHLDENLQDFRWMIEELRVSMFAQTLKTSMPISVKRLEKKWQALS
ncbi:MAG: ATP-dependent RNA helicase HrpA [Mariprofundaceae bacterium]